MFTGQALYVVVCLANLTFHSLLKMITSQQKAQCVLWFAETKSATMVQREFRNHYHIKPPTRASLYRWKKQFKETGSVEGKKSSGRPQTLSTDVQRVRQAFERSPRTSIRKTARELNLPRSTVHDIVRKKPAFVPLQD